MGNEGSVSAFDAAEGMLFAMLASNTTSRELRLASIDVASATVLFPPPVLEPFGLGLIFNLVVADETSGM